MADEKQVATPGRVVHYHPALPEIEDGDEGTEREWAPVVGIVVGDAPEGGVDLYLLPTRHDAGGVVQAVRHDDDAPEDDDPDDEAQPRTHQSGTWGWPPRS